MDIQRGDQVYYRGAVWTVWHVWPLRTGHVQLSLHRGSGYGAGDWAVAFADQTQRVEQVR